MESHDHLPPRNTFQVLRAFLLGIAIIVYGVIRITIVLLPRSLGGWPIRRTILVSFVQAYFAVTGKLVGPRPRETTGEVVRAYGKKHGEVITSRTIDCGPEYPAAVLHHIGLAPEAANSDPITATGRPQRRALLYLHGGGYVFAATPVHVAMAVALGSAAQAQENVYVLEYRIAPFAKYPTQLVQGINALRYLIAELNFSPNQIIICGDSAGGNLAMGILAHLKQPSPYTAPVMLATQLLAVVALSPWASFETEGESSIHAGREDMISVWMGDYLTGFWEPRREIWAEPVSRQASNIEGFWAVGLPTTWLVITTGAWEASRTAHELLADGCGATKIQVGGYGERRKDALDRTEKEEIERALLSKRQLIVGKGEVHVQAGLDFSIGLEESGSFLAVKKLLCRID